MTVVVMNSSEERVTKKCSKCNETKSLDEFYNESKSKDGKGRYCKDCNKKRGEYYTKHNYENRALIREQMIKNYHFGGGRERRGHQSMYKNKSCSQYLGIVAAERLVKHLFNDVEMMPPNFHGYDLICNRGKKIDVKASTTHIRKNKNSIVNRWQFSINCNKDCDYFLCMAFDNIKELNPLIAWMIPGNEVNDQGGIAISSTTIQRWDKWKMDLSNAQACCDLMKGKGDSNNA